MCLRFLREYCLLTDKFAMPLTVLSEQGAESATALSSAYLSR